MKVSKDMIAKQEGQKGTEDIAVKDEDVVIEEEDNEEEATIRQEQLDEWKKEYGKIFQTVIGTNIYIWRRIRRSEYVDAMTDNSYSEDNDRRIYERQEAILRKVCLYPSPLKLEKLIEEEGCLATCLGSEILDRSGFSLPITVPIS